MDCSTGEVKMYMDVDLNVSDMDFDQKSKKRKNGNENKMPVKDDNKNSNQLIKKYKVKYSFLIFFVITMAANGISVAWTTGGNNQTANIFAAKLNWSGEETRVYNSLINLAS